MKVFSSATCKCTKRKGSPCSSYFSVDGFWDHRMQMAELDHDSLGILILSQLNAHHFSEDLQGHGSKATAGERKDYMHFYFHSHPMFGNLLVFTWHRQKAF